MAKDLAVRLLPAFDTESGIPHPRVHLQFGVPNATICDFCRTETNPAGAGSMMLEFGILSRLLRDSRFEVAAQKVCCWTVICHLSILTCPLIQGSQIRLEATIKVGAFRQFN